MAAFIRNVTFDCADPVRLADFWGAALGLTERNVKEEEVLLANAEWGFPRLSFQHVPEAKAVKNRVHLDITAERLDVEVERLRDLGATVLKIVEREDFAWVVMQDPESNEFCVTAAGD
jgi:predicted enzyme related to lactoylglutathione lyase